VKDKIIKRGAFWVKNADKAHPYLLGGIYCKCPHCNKFIRMTMILYENIRKYKKTHPDWKVKGLPLTFQKKSPKERKKMLKELLGIE